MSIQRYDFHCSGVHAPMASVFREDEGDYVLFSDHAAEVSTLEAKNARLTARCAGLKRLQREMKDAGIEGAAFYLEEDTLHLMVGPSHNLGDGQARRDNSIASVTLPGSGGRGMVMSEKLKPCPWCSGTKAYFTQANGNAWYCLSDVACPDCKREVHAKDAITAWNLLPRTNNAIIQKG